MCRLEDYGGINIIYLKRDREAKLALLDRVIEDNRLEVVRADKIMDFGDGKYGQIMFHNGDLVAGT